MLLFSFGSLFSKVLKGGAGFLSGGPAGAARALIGTTGQGPRRVPGIGGFIERIVPGGRSGFFDGGRGFGGGGGREVRSSIVQEARENTAAMGLVCPSGETPNKSRYHLKDGTLIEPGTRCVKIRRIDVGNAKALRRSIRRENGFVKLAKRALRGGRFKVTSASAGVRRGPRTIVESGPGSVVTR